MNATFNIQTAAKTAAHHIAKAPKSVINKLAKAGLNDGLFIGSAVELAAKGFLNPKSTACTQRLVWVIWPTSNSRKFSFAPYCNI